MRRLSEAKVQGKSTRCCSESRQLTDQSTQCNAGRPKCSLCLSHGTDCIYETASTAETHGQALKRKFTELTDRKAAFQLIYELLQSRPKVEADEVFRRIRGGGDAESILKHVQEAELLRQLSLIPETRYRYDFPFIKEMPAFLQHPDNPYLKSPIYEWASKGISGAKQELSSPQLGDSDYKSLYLSPYHAAEIVEPRINDVIPSEWTNVSSDDGLMRTLLAEFFMFQYPWLGSLFHKDYFLADMVAKRHRFCSSLLVTAILTYACVCAVSGTIGVCLSSCTVVL
jgi:Fungal Zn(2)-Cys(6) binuclear cluster domain